MDRLLIVMFGIASICGVQLSGQTTYPFIAELRQNYGFVKNNLLRLAEKMPEEHYRFKPTPEIRSFTEAIAHVADSQARSCSMVNGAAKTVDAESRQTKAD